MLIRDTIVQRESRHMDRLCVLLDKRMENIVLKFQVMELSTDVAHVRAKNMLLKHKLGGFYVREVREK